MILRTYSNSQLPEYLSKQNKRHESLPAGNLQLLGMQQQLHKVKKFFKKNKCTRQTSQQKWKNLLYFDPSQIRREENLLTSLQLNPLCKWRVCFHLPIRQSQAGRNMDQTYTQTILCFHKLRISEPRIRGRVKETKHKTKKWRKT